MPDNTAAQPQAGEEQQPPAGNAEPQAGDAQEPQGSESISVEEAKKLRSEANALRRRTKEAEAELEKLRTASMDEHQREIEKAKAEARAEALREARVEVVQSKIEAAAAGRFRDPAELIAYLDLSKFLTEDGDIDQEAINQAVDRLAEGVSGRTVGTPDGGIRPSPPAKVDMSELLRIAAKG